MILTPSFYFSDILTKRVKWVYNCGDCVPTFMKSTSKKTYLQPEQLAKLATLQADFSKSESKVIGALINVVFSIRVLHPEMYDELINNFK